MRIIGSIIGLFLTGIFFFMVYRLIMSFLTKDNSEDDADENKKTKSDAGPK
jgi:hypothetical protein